MTKVKIVETIVENEHGFVYLLDNGSIVFTGKKLPDPGRLASKHGSPRVGDDEHSIILTAEQSALIVQARDILNKRRAG